MTCSIINRFSKTVEDNGRRREVVGGGASLIISYFFDQIFEFFNQAANWKASEAQTTSTMTTTTATTIANLNNYNQFLNSTGTIPETSALFIVGSTLHLVLALVLLFSFLFSVLVAFLVLIYSRSVYNSLWVPRFWITLFAAFWLVCFAYF